MSFGQHSSRHRSAYADVVSWRALSYRYSPYFFLLAALGLLVFGHVKPQAVDGVRTQVVDRLSPVLNVIAQPMRAIEGAVDEAHSYLNVREENARLRAANEQLLQAQNAAVALQNENRDLRDLLNFKAEPGLAYISARVIADTGGAFARGLIVTAGKTDGVREGMAAMTGEGLIGRVVEVGDWSSRIMLLTDLSSKIPVTVTGSGERAILSGDNSAMPQLLYLPQDAVLTPGTPVITSGHGGVFPPNLAVGTIAKTDRDGTTILPAADLSRISYVRLVDFNLKGGEFNPIAKRLEAEKAKKK